MNDALPANAVWTWTWTGGPLAGTVQPLIGNQIELYPDRESRLPLIKLWHTPAGFVVQIAGKKVMRDGVCADVLLLQPGDCLRTKEFAAVIDCSPIEAESASFAPSWNLEPDCVLDDSAAETNSFEKVATSDELDEASAELEQPSPARSPEGVEDSGALDQIPTDTRETQSTGSTHFHDALQALESIKRQLLAAPQGMSTAVVESLDDITRRLDSTAELIKKLAESAEEVASDSSPPNAQAEQHDAPDQLKRILKRLEEESVDITDLVQLKANKSISDAELLQINPINLTMPPPAATEDTEDGVEVSPETLSQPIPVVVAIGDSSDVSGEQLESLNNVPRQESLVAADPEQVESGPELQQFGESEADAAVASPELGRASETENSPLAEYEAEITNATTRNDGNVERMTSEMHSASDSPTDTMDSVVEDACVDIVDYSRFEAEQPTDYVGDSTMPRQEFAYGLSDTSYPNDFFAPLEPATAHYSADIDSFPPSDHMMNSPYQGEVIERDSNVPVEVALANLNLIDESGSATAEVARLAEQVEFQGQPTLNEFPSSTEQTSGLSTAAYLSSVLQAESQDDRPLQEETPIVDQSPVANYATYEHDSDDGINDYMNQLFTRLRGGKAPMQTPASPEKKKEVVEPATAATPSEDHPPIVPLKEEEFVPQKSAPELQKDMNAMRRLANESTRAALSTFNEQRLKALANARIGAIFGLIGFAATMLLISRGFGDMFNLVGISALIAAAGTAVWHYLELKKFKQLLQETDTVAALTNSDNT